MMYPQMIQGNGIMTDLTSYNVPWKEETFVSLLDIGYYSHSAQKNVSPIVNDICETVPLTSEERTTLAGMIYHMFAFKWDRLYSLYSEEYNPINNYRMQEDETIERDLSVSGTDTGTINTANNGTVSDSGTDTGTLTKVTDGEVRKTGTVGDSGTDTGTLTKVTDGEVRKTGTVGDSGTDTGTLTKVTDGEVRNTGTQTNSGTSNTEDGIFGFNSSVSVGSNTSDNTNSNTRTDNLTETDDTTVTETHNLSKSNTRTDNLTETDDTTVTETHNLSDSNTRTLNTVDLETRNLANSRLESDDTDRSITREGTTGIYTPQQLINEEIELWQWNFYRQVFEDIDSILCLSIY